MPGGSTGGFNVGSSLQYERGILLLEDCEGIDVWDGSGTGSDYAVDFITQAAFYGSKGLQIQTKTTTPTDGDVVAATRLLPMPAGDRVVIRMRVQTVFISTLDHYYAKFHVHDGSREYAAAIRVSLATPKLEYLDLGGSWVEVSGYGQKGTNYSWHILEFQVDVGSKEYLSVLYQGIETDLSGIKYQDVGASVLRYTKIELAAEAAAGDSVKVYFDAIYVGEFVKL